MLIEQPVYSGSTQYFWTDDNDVGGLTGTWLYLSGVVMHEFGHTWGLGHPPAPPSLSIMGYANNAALPISDDAEAMRAVNDGHSH